MAIETGADLSQRFGSGSHGQTGAAGGNRQPVIGTADVVSGDTEALEQPVGQHQFNASHPQVGSLVERFDLLGEVLLDDLAPRSALGRQLAPFLAEVAIDHRKVDDALVRREELVDRNDHGDEVVRGLSRGQRGEVQLAVVGVGVDQQRVVLAMVADQEGAADGFDITEEVLHALGCDGLAADVLVDLLLAIDQPQVTVFFPLHQVAGVEPALLVEGGLAVRRVEVADHHVRSADQQFAVLGEGRVDARQGSAQRSVTVVARHRHRDAAGGLGHAEAADEVDTLALEEAEDLGVEVACGGQPESQPAAGDLLRGGGQFLVRGLQHVRLLRDQLV